MANTFIPIAKAVLTTTQTTIEFNSISSSYDDLYVVGSARASTGSDRAIYIVGNYATTGYPSTSFIGWEADGTSLSQNTFANQGSMPGSTATANLFNAFECYIPNYRSANNKIFHTYTVWSNNSTTTATGIRMTSARLTDTNTISSLRIVSSGSGFVTGTRFDLYGIKNS